MTRLWNSPVRGWLSVEVAVSALSACTSASFSINFPIN